MSKLQIEVRKIADGQSEIKVCYKNGQTLYQITLNSVFIGREVEIIRSKWGRNLKLVEVK